MPCSKAPLTTVYNRWAQIEESARFMDGVEEVRQGDDTHLHRAAQFEGARHEWDAEITEQKPDERGRVAELGRQGQRRRGDLPPPR